MRAIVTKPFKGCKDGELHPVDLAEGDAIEGDLAKEAINAGWAEEEAEDGEPKKAPKNKAAWTPKNKKADAAPGGEE